MFSPPANNDSFATDLGMSQLPEMFQVYNETVKANPVTPSPWGFYVFRTAYRDQDLWGEYMNHIRKQASQFLAGEVHGPEILPHLHFTPVEDRLVLEGASKEEVRQIFRTMVDGLPRDGDATRHIPPADARSAARYSYCMYVDDECLNSFARLDWQKIAEARRLSQRSDEQFNSLGPDAYVIVIDGEDDDDEFSIYPEEELGEPEDEEDRSWMPVECRWLAWFYAELSSDDEEVWDRGWEFCDEVRRSSEDKMRPWREPPINLFGE